MIKVGDIININGNDEIIKEINKYMIVLKNGLCYTHEEVYVQLYEQQKQRADELEKRWSELRNLIIDKAHFYENEGFMHQGAILVDVVEDMEQLEKENNNA